MAKKKTKKTDQELKKLAADIADGRVYTDRHLDDPSIFTLVFMPLALMSSDSVKSMQDVGLIYEYLDKAGPRSVNGQPIFMSFHMLTKEETTRMFTFYNEIVEMKKKFMEDVKEER